MKRSRWLVISWLAASLGIDPVALAQQNNPHIGYVYPAGCQQGTTIRVKIGGQFLEGVSAVFFSGNGIQATVVEHNKPPTNRELNTLREKIQELQKKGRDAATLEEIAGIREKIAAFSRNANPVIAELVTLEIKVAQEAEPGKYELRLGTPLGLSNPLVFCVGQLPEFREKEPKASKAEAETGITLPATVNGQIMPGSIGPYRLAVRQFQRYMPGDADRYRFSARKGQQLVVSASARELIPYLADAVPGWFQATATLYDAGGNEVAYGDDYRFHPDPVLHYEIPKDGDYILEIKDAIYRGRDDFVYRVMLGELPFVASIFPLGGRAGTETSVQIKGWNLPATTLTMNAKDKGAGIYPLSVHKGELVSNHVPFAVDTLPESLEKEPNDPQKKAQRITYPIVVNGRINKPGDWDIFSFKGRTGDQIVAEVLARRLDSPLDSVLKLTDANGLQLAFNDDHEDKGSGLNTHHADSYLTATLPANGTYCLHLGDAQHKGGPEYAYRLRISPPRPDFDLRVAQSSINASIGATVPITVYALRKDGFSGDIELALKGTPKGFFLSGGLVPAQQDRVRLTLTVPPAPLQEPLSLNLEGRATIQGQEIVRQAMPTDDMMQAFAYRHLVPAKDLRVAVVKRGGGQGARIFGEQPIKIPAGGTAQIRVGMPAIRFFEKVQFELSEPPDGVTMGAISMLQQGAELVLQCDAAKVKPGLRGNLIVSVTGERAPAAGGQNVPANRRRIPIGTLPAISFEIVKP